MKLIPREQLPEHLRETFGISKTMRQIDYWRRKGRGPAYHQIEGRYYYDVEDVAEWISSSRVDPDDINDHSKEDTMGNRCKPAGGC